MFILTYTIKGNKEPLGHARASSWNEALELASTFFNKEKYTHSLLPYSYLHISDGWGEVEVLPAPHTLVVGEV